MRMMVLVVPLGIAGVWVALALLLDAYKLWRQSREPFPAAADETSEADDAEGASKQAPAPQPPAIPAERESQFRTRQ